MMMMMKDINNKIERMSSIEKEPQTLFLDQINDARKAALYVLSTNTIEEAIRIFTEGLEPVVVSVKNGGNNNNMEMRKMMMMDSADQDHHRTVLQDEEYLRDIATAPF